MEKIKELFTDSIYLNGNKEDGIYSLTLSQLEQVGKESVELSADIAIKFANWVNCLSDMYKDVDSYKKLFNIFINNYYK